MDGSFGVDAAGLAAALAALGETPAGAGAGDALAALPAALPATGAGDRAALDTLAPLLLGGAARLDDPLAFAHMDPPTPWLTWAVALWNARLNQNLLHPATAPVARAVERRVAAWLAPFFGMEGGHLTPGSTVANLTALWAAREVAGVAEVVAAETAHVSIEKAARLLGLPLRRLPTDRAGRLRPEAATGLDRACLVLTAGTTASGVVDPLGLAGRAAWTHVDAAWAGPLRLSPRHAGLLDGIGGADSVAVSAHKWLFQPKESALVLFRDEARAHDALTVGGGYLAAPNVGLLGSHGATAAPLLATLLAWGREGVAARLDACMAAAARFAAFVAAEPRLELFAPPETGVVLWRPRASEAAALAAALPAGLASTARAGGETWLRCVAANPLVDVGTVTAAVAAALDRR